LPKQKQTRKSGGGEKQKWGTQDPYKQRGEVAKCKGKLDQREGKNGKGEGEGGEDAGRMKKMKSSETYNGARAGIGNLDSLGKETIGGI